MRIPHFLLPLSLAVLLSACPPRPNNQGGTPDATPPECTAASECPGELPVCETGRSCGCGRYKTCVEGRCSTFTQDCLDGGGMDASVDAGDAECVAAADCPGLFPECAGIGACGCGTFKTCHQGLCLSYSVDRCASDAGTSNDGGGDDGGSADAAMIAECTVAADCPQPYEPCADFSSCGCGTFKTCFEGRCLGYSSDNCPRDQ